MLLFIKNFFKDAWVLYKKEMMFAIAGVVIFVLLLLLGCAGTKTEPIAEGPGYCLWKDAPAWAAKDFIMDENGYGLIDGYKFMGNHGLPCYAIKVDTPPIDYSCDAVVVVCETGNTDDRYGPGTPLVRGVGPGALPCDRWDSLIKAIKKDEAQKLM
jgi:hypothetical protein